MSNTQTKKPTHRAYVTKEGQDKTFWNRIGSAWEHKDGRGFYIKLDMIPVGGEIVIREIKSDESDQMQAS